MGVKTRPLEDGAFRALLAWLDPDPNQAGAAYAKLHRRLRLYFESWRDAARHAEELADAAIDRAVGKLAEDPSLADRHANAYIRTIAAYILKEYRSQSKSVGLTIDPPDVRPGADDDSREHHRCLAFCLSRLTRGEYELVMSYYADEPGASTATWRKQVLPDKLGKSYGAIRVQVLRIRRTLEQCIEECLKA